MVKSYCERCDCKQGIEIVKEDYEINVYGKKVNYIGKKAKPGDLVFIYRTGDRYPKRYSSVVTGLAIIEDIIYTSSVKECISWSSIYSRY